MRLVDLRIFGDFTSPDPDGLRRRLAILSLRERLNPSVGLLMSRPLLLGEAGRPDILYTPPCQDPQTRSADRKKRSR